MCLTIGTQFAHSFLSFSLTACTLNNCLPFHRSRKALIFLIFAEAHHLHHLSSEDTFYAVLVSWCLPSSVSIVHAWRSLPLVLSPPLQSFCLCFPLRISCGLCFLQTPSSCWCSWLYLSIHFWFSSYLDFTTNCESITRHCKRHTDEPGLAVAWLSQCPTLFQQTGLLDEERPC